MNKSRPARPAIKGILFDKDGTLFDYTATWMPLNHRAALMAARGNQERAHELMELGGWQSQTNTIRSGSLLAAHTNYEIATAWSDALEDWTTDELYQAITHIFNTYGLQSATPVTDLPELLSRLAGLGYTLGVATSDNEASTRAMLDRFHVETRFDFIAGYDSGYGVKPGPGMVHAFCKQCDLDVSEVIVVGDNYHDMEMGDKAGVAFSVGVLSGNSTRADLSAHTDYILEDVTGLAEFLNNLSG